MAWKVLPLFLVLITFTGATSAGWVLLPFGSVTDLIQKQNPWYGFDVVGPVLTIVRVQQFHTDSCEKWAEALLWDVPGTKWMQGPTRSDAYLAWEPWSADERESVSSCNQFPCNVKLDSAETSKMAKVSLNARLKEFQTLVWDRVSHYQKTGERRAYEFPGKLSDPWEILEKKGLVPRLSLPQISKLYLRKLDFAPGKIRPLRQVLDRRTLESIDEASHSRVAAVWVRDVYTNHYFDSWGEGSYLSCKGTAQKEVLLIQSLIVELDLLKKTDLISRLMRGKMKSAVKENGVRYLNKAYDRFLAKSLLVK